jgi:hypothetical protein
MTHQKKRTKGFAGLAARRGVWGVAAVLLQAGCDAAPPAQPGAPATPAAMTDSLGTPLGPITSEIVARNAGLSQQLHLLARVEVQPNEMLEFYEPMPGSILVSGAGAPAGGSLLASRPDASVEQWWRDAAGANRMPAALTEAVARARLAAPLSPGRGAPPAANQGGGAEGAVPGNLEGGRPPVPPRREPFHAAVGYCDDPGGYFANGASLCPRSAARTLCRNGHGNGIFTGQDAPTYAVRSNVCPTNGSVVLRLEAWERPSSCPLPLIPCTDTSGVTIGTWDQYVPANTLRWWTWENIPNRPIVRSQVVQASGVRFHFVYGMWFSKPFSIWE